MIMRKSKSEQVVGIIMSVQDFREWARSVQRGTHKLKGNAANKWRDFSDGGSFYNDEGPEEAIKNITFGRPDLYREIPQKEIKAVHELVGGMVQTPEFDVIGSSVSVPRHIQGHPLTLRRTKSLPGGLSRVVIDLTTYWGVNAEYRMRYAMAGLGMAQALAMRGPTELYLMSPCSGKGVQTPPWHPKQTHVVSLFPMGLSPWDMSMLCGMTTSSVYRGLMFTHEFEVHLEAFGHEMLDSLPLYQGQPDDLLEKVFPDWNAERSIFLPGIKHTDWDDAQGLKPHEWAMRRAVIGSALK